MFTDQIRLYGKHAEYIKKYSTDKQAETQYQFLISTINNDKKIIHIFDTMIEAYMVAGMIGIIERKSVPEDMENKSIYANIMADTVIDRISQLNKIIQFMILSDEQDTLTADEKIKKAFTIKSQQNNTLEKQLGGYVRGGLEIIDDYFKNCETYEDIATKLLDLVEKFS